MKLRGVPLSDIADFRQMVETYWQEIMPHSARVKNQQSREAYFQERFPFGDDSLSLFWGIVDGRRIGFVAFSLNHTEHSAMIEDFYVVPEARRRGFGTELVNTLSVKLDQLGIELVELTVRRDTPQALAFWEAQGFRIAGYRLRQYRDPKHGTAYLGALSSDFSKEEP